MKDVEYALLVEALMLRVSAGLMTSPDDIALIIRCVNSQGLAILKDADDTSIGYVAWASVNKYSILNLMNNRILPKYFYEFSEGNICLILSVLFLPGRSSEAIRSFKSFVKVRRVFAFIRKNKAVYLIRRKNTFYKGVSKRFSVCPMLKKVAP